MKKEYTAYENVTKEILDTIKVGDLIKVNDWGKPLRVKGVSKNYFVMAAKQFKDTIYSVCEKKVRTLGRHNNMTEGMFHCGTDNWIFGDINFDYKFDDAEAIDKYLQSFEDGKTEISERSGIPINLLYIKTL